MPRTYPPDTNAFLYYTVPSGKPRIAGELRLRVASSDNPASFATGLDLLKIDGQLWSRPLLAISKYYSPLYAKLRQDGLVPDDLASILSTLPKAPRYSHSQILYTLNDTFIIDFSIPDLSFPIITEQGRETLRFSSQFCDHRYSRQGRPYTGAYTHHCSQNDDSHASIGSVLARFERSTLPEHAGTRTIVLRFLKIITPVKCVMPHYDNYIAFPKEGELYQRTRKRTSYWQVWSVNVDQPKPMARIFRLLWDA